VPRNRRIPSYRFHKGSNQAIVVLDGRTHYLGPWNSPASRAECDRLVAEWLANGRRSAPVAPAPSAEGVTVDELILVYWRHAEGYYRKPDGTPSPELENLKLALRPLRKLYGETPAAGFGPLALKAVRQSMVDAGLARITVNQRVARIVRCFRHAVEMELVPPDVHLRLKAVEGLRKGRSGAREGRKVRPVSDGDVDAVKPHVSRQVWAMIELQRLTGARSGEIVRMRTIDLDTSGDVWVYVPASHKTERHDIERRIFLGPRAQAILRPWLRTDLEGFLFQPREAMEEHRAESRRNRRTPLTPSQRARKRKSRPRKAPGERYTSRSYFRAVAKACVKAGTPHWHPHQLRHSSATSIRKEFGLDTARIILGHTSATVTEVYAEQDLSKARAAMREIG
jgi:integrase